MHKPITLFLLLISLSFAKVNKLNISISKTDLLKDETTTLTITPKDINLKKIKWIVSPKNSLIINNLTITPKEDTTITLKAKYKNIISNPITLHVKWIVNGHTLPPKPDESINNSTLLGIDVNSNDVRDDVERWIYETYKDKHPIHIDIAMQAGRAYKKVLQMPERALEIHDEVSAPLYCELYFRRCLKRIDKTPLINVPVDNKNFRHNIYFNTKERYRVYKEEYDRRLSGNTFTLIKCEDRKKLCDFNTSKYDKN